MIEANFQDRPRLGMVTRSIIPLIGDFHSVAGVSEGDTGATRTTEVLMSAHALDAEGDEAKAEDPATKQHDKKADKPLHT